MYSSPNIRLVPFERTTWPGHVVYIMELTNTYRKPEVKKLCERLDHRKEDDVTVVFMK